MTLVLIASVAQNMVIGRNGQLVFKNRLDMQRFRQLTIGNPVIMGKRTFDSLPPKYRPLPDRTNIVLTHQSGFQHPGVIVACSIDHALELAGSSRPIYVIGRAQVYNQTISKANNLELTEVKLDLPGDAYFPEYKDGQWSEVQRTSYGKFDFVTYLRRE